MVNTNKKSKKKMRIQKAKAKEKEKRRRRRTTRRLKHQNNKHKPIVYGHVFSTECGHCINMNGDWEKLTKEVGKDITLVDISNNHQGKVDAFNTAYQTDLKFEGFPTIFKLSQKNAPVEYFTGDRTTDNMKNNWLYN
jgi:hypothetical protein